MSETRRVLVTGGAGFVGATLVRRLVGERAPGPRVRQLLDGRRAHLGGVDAELVEGDIRDGGARCGAGRHGGRHPSRGGRHGRLSVEDPATNFDSTCSARSGCSTPPGGPGWNGPCRRPPEGLIGDATHRSTSGPCRSRSRRTARASSPAKAMRTPFRSVRPARGGVSVRERYGPWSAQKRGAMTCSSGRSNRRPDRDLRRWFVIARLHPRR